ncbi:MAG: phosphotransferase [Reinekea sp.]|jgi:Ser/Thr protein kinase RdoA (MazF antagonist)|nr:phosphotransferase [Reinekea sp.]
MAGEPVQRRLQFVLEHFGKRPTENVILNYFGLANEVYIITTAEGKFVVKNCFKNNTEELVANEAALIEFLNKQNVPCPALVPTAKGDPYLKYDGHFYIMSEFMNGYTPTWEENLSPTLARETMRAMAEYHRATQNFEPPFDNKRLNALDIDAAKAWLMNLSQQLDDDTSGRDSVKKMRPLVAELLTVADDLAADLQQVDLSQLQQVYIHGDLHCFNLIFSEDKQSYSGIVDFDFIRRDYRLVDFYWASRSIMWTYICPQLFSFKPSSSGQKPTTEQSAQVVREAMAFMIDEYRKHNELPDAEIAQLPVFAKALPLFTVRFFNLSNSEEECLAHADWFSYQLTHLQETVDGLRVAIDEYLQR